MIPRTLYLGEEAIATASFYSDSGVSLEPRSSIFPTYRVFSPERELITAGVGAYSDAKGIYEAVIVIPVSAPLSQDTGSYFIDWVMEAKPLPGMKVGETLVFRESFDVAHPSFNITGSKEHQKLTLPFVSLALSMPFLSEPEILDFKIVDSNSTSVFSGMPQPTGIYSGYNIYSIDIPANTLTAGKDYLSIWSFTTRGGEQSAYTQPVYCATLDDMTSASNMRMRLDKVMKDQDLFQGYRDSELIHHYRQAPSLINTIGLFTDWTLVTWNTDFLNHKWLLMEAAYYSALRGQFLAEADSTFDFSHQSTTISVDRTGFIESELGRLWDYLQAVVPEFKKTALKYRSNVGHLGISIPTVGTAWGRQNRTFEGIPLPRPVFMGR